MITLRRSDDEGKGTWRKFTAGTRTFVMAFCPDCGGGAVLQSGEPHDHAIAADGAVTPSVQCVYQGCSFHQTGVRLEGWDG